MDAIKAREVPQSEADIRGTLDWSNQAGQRQTLYLRVGDTVGIGRDVGNEIVLDSPRISRRHAVIAWRDNGFEVADLGSMNGTLVNGERIAGARHLGNDDVIRLYDIELTFHVASEVAPAEAPQAHEKTFVVLPSAPQPRLIISAGAQEGREIPLHAGKVIIGRATAKDTWDIALQDRAISRPHAQVEMVENSFVITDVGSANGTLVNGVVIAEPVGLRDGDVIALGETTLLFRDK